MSLRPRGAVEDARIEAYPATWEDGGAAARDREGVPVRPALSAALVALFCAWAAVLAADAASLTAGCGGAWFGFDPRAVLGAAAVFVLAGFVGFAWRFRRGRAVLLIAAVGLAAGLVTGLLSIESTLAQAGRLGEHAVSAYRFVVQTDPQPTATGGWRFEAQTTEGGPVPGARVWVDVSCSVDVDARGNPGLAGMGCVVALVGRWKPLDPGDEFDASLAGRGVCARVVAMQVEQVGTQGGFVGAVRAMRARMLDAAAPYSSEARALAAGVVCGMQAALAAFEASDDFSKLGLSHLVAVSGSHLALVSALLLALLRRTSARPGFRCGLLVAVLGAYVAFTGFQPSAVRSWVMASFALLAGVAGRRAHAVSAVSVAALAMLLFEPSNAQNMGFSLSVLSVVGLTAFAALAQAWTRTALPSRTPRFVGESLALTGVSQVFTMPVALPAFGNVALLAPLANVVVGPLVSALLVVGLACFVLVALVPAGAVDVVMAPCDALAGLSCRIARAMAGVAGTTLMVEASAPALGASLACAALVVYWLWPRPSRRAVLLGAAGASLVLGCCVVAWRFAAPPRVVVLDVGQGDAVLVQDGPRAVLIDTGPDDAVCYALTRNRVLYLDAVVVTHTDSDHVGGLDDLAGQVGVGSVVVAQGVADAAARDEPAVARTLASAGEAVVEVACGDVIEVGRFELEVLWPREPVAGSENEHSIVLLLTYRDPRAPDASFKALLTGDAESEVVDGLVATGRLGRVDVLKVGHHGSAASTSAAMLRSLEPVLAVASAGEGNRYGHPADACVEACAQAGVPFVCTMDCGDVALHMGENGARAVFQNAA